MLNYQNDSNIRLIKNNTGADVGQYEVLKLDGALITPTDNATGWLQRQTFKGITPTADCDFAITQRSVPDGKTQPAIFSGVTPCTVSVSDASHTHAIAGTTAAKLVSATSGPAKILWKESGTGDKNAVVQLSQGGSAGTEPVIGRHLDCQREQFRGVARRPYGSGPEINPCAFDGQPGSNVVSIINQSNDRTIIGPSGVNSKWSIKKAGVYAYSFPWSIIIHQPDSEVASVGPLLTENVEFSYDGSGHVDGIRNNVAAEGTDNPTAKLYRYPKIDIYAFLFDGARAVPSIESGYIFGSDAGGGGFNTVIEGGGTDSNSDTYGPLWEYYLADNYNVISNGCISGAFSISQDAIDNLSGGASIGLDFKADTTPSNTAVWEFSFGGFVIYSPLLGDMAGDDVGTIYRDSGVQPLG